MDVTGKTRIFKNEYGGNTYYSTSISNKKADGTYDKMYLSVQFKKGMETEGDIEITRGFLSFFKDKNGMCKVKIVIMEFTKAEGDYIDVDNDVELPF